MKLPLIITLLVLLMAGIYAFSTGSFLSDKTYNWNVELTKPLHYEVKINYVSYWRNGEEIYRHTSLNSFSGWKGTEGGRVLHNKLKEHLPDSMKISWTELKTDITYSAELAFPKGPALHFWDENYKMLQEKWGADYPKGALSLKLGLAPGGHMNLWLNGLDVNTSGFSMELASHTAKTDITQVAVDALYERFNNRFGSAHFHTFKGKNVVAINVAYYNGEVQTISLKNENGSILESTNRKRGWAMAKEITVTWFNENDKGYKSKYEVNFNETTINSSIESFRSTDLVYLLDRPNTPEGEWNDLSDFHVFQLAEVSREAIN